MKTVFFNRHAKSDWSNYGLRDFDRPLNKRGLRDSPNMGRRLKLREEKIDLFISSPANRAISTARLMAHNYGYDESSIVEIKTLYLPGISSFVEVLDELDDRINSVILFAHNPGITEVVEYFTETDLVNIPTCGIAKVVFLEAESWKEVSRGTGHLAYFDFPKKDFQ